jgi:catechol 2,3-dioxygenase-like lactoylglutathione lyase family enzyme
MLRLPQTTFLVDDYDEAIAYFTSVLEFSLVEDTALSATKRWVVLEAGAQSGRLLLAQPGNDEQAAHIGHAAGGRVAFFLYTDEFADYHQRLVDRGVHFDEEPRHEAWGWVCVFRDRYGNRWDLIEDRDELSTTRAVVSRHLDSLNRHDAAGFFATLSPDILWSTGTDVISGLPAVRELFDEGFWSWKPELTITNLVVDGRQAMAEVHEILHVAGQSLEFDIAVSLSVDDGLITSVKTYREGTSDF